METQSWTGAGEVLQVEVVLPVQFFGPLRTRVSDQGGEYRLLAAVLEDAINCFQRHAFASDPRSRRLFEETETWILDRSANSDGPFSFGYICAVLGLDADCLREGLQRWRQERLAHLALASTGARPRYGKYKDEQIQNRRRWMPARDGAPAAAV